MKLNIFVVALCALGASAKVREIPQMSLPELVNYWGYEFEEHFITTDDGYILGIHRIPGKTNVDPAPFPKPVVLLGHAMLSSSAQWIFGPPEKSMGYVLVDAGYDVWMTNNRGNTFSKNHTQYDVCSSCPEFWSFGFHEGGTLDYPKVIDYVLEKTGQDDLFFVGHSMGTTQYTVLLSELPEYNSKIKAGFLMAPAVFMTHATDSIFLLSQWADEIQDLFEWFGLYEFLPHPDIVAVLAHIFCNGVDPVYTEICENIGFLLFGVNLDQLNTTMIPTYLDHHPAGMSTRPLIHFAQLHLVDDAFVFYDFGSPEENLAQYGTETPPVYDLSKVTVPTAIYAGDSDDTSTPTDCQHLYEVLPNAIHYEVVALPGCTHLDFAIAIDAREKIYDPIMKKMEEFLKQEKNLG